MSAIAFPTIDGHFWIERNGKIIDIEFNEYNDIKKYRGCKGGMVHKEADDMTQAVMIKIYDKCLTSVGLNMAKFKAFSVRKGIKPQFQMCYQNCLLEMKEGDVLKFGSMGWKRSDGVWWEYGGENYKGVKSFIK